MSGAKYQPENPQPKASDAIPLFMPFLYVIMSFITDRRNGFRGKYG
jgi:hypothetical protein